MAENTKIRQCKCDSKFQDLKYGKGNRVCNLTEKGNSLNPVNRCTVCGSEK